MEREPHETDEHITVDITPENQGLNVMVTRRNIRIFSHRDEVLPYFVKLNRRFTALDYAFRGLIVAGILQSLYSIEQAIETRNTVLGISSAVVGTLLVTVRFLNERRIETSVEESREVLRQLRRIQEDPSNNTRN